ncbi:carbon storage regulator CsrA [Paenibacillus timonensis]|uniref:carbon storage regulator CsrA n=1 Tax=Paenibacillus timonensis TaxID=225915 RepID=UPI003F9E3317
MLVLSRKKGESIMISDTIEIVVLETEGETVKLGIKAPKNVEIHRKEVYMAIQESNREASSDKAALLQKLASWEEDK